jgi:hypothetical protein
MMTNGELLEISSEDMYCFSIRPPETVGDRIRIQILPDDPAIAISNIREAPYDVRSVRAGKIKDLWLISAGVLVFNEKLQLAMGKRNFMGTDPGLWTNLVAGRCDDRIKTHSIRELAEEFHCYIRSNQGHKNRYIRLLPDILKNTDQLPFILMQKAVDYGSYEWIPFHWKSIRELTGIYLRQWKTIEIIWPDEVETFDAFVFLDEMNKTVEIRFAGQVRLKGYGESFLLFPEGEMTAEWISLDQLLYLRHREKRDQIQTFVPFMRYFLDSLSQTFLKSGNHYQII